MPVNYPALFQSHAEKVGSLLSEVHEGKLALPDFQRSFIWPARHSARLLASIMARYPAGAILTWRPSDHGLAERSVEGAPAIPQGIGLPERLVLDGQQRLTSLYRAMHGSGDARFTISVAEFIDPDTFAATSLEDVNWDAVVTAHEPTAKQRKARADKGELPEYERADWQLQQWQFPVDELLVPGGFDVWLDKLAEALPEGKDKDLCKLRLREVRDAFLNQLSLYEFPVITLTPAASLQAVCRIFETLNSNAVRLGVFEILTARFYPEDVDLRALWREAKAQYVVLRDPVADKDADGFAIDPYTVLQVIALRAHNSPQQKTIIEKLTASDVKKHWDGAVGALKNVIEYLRDVGGIIHRDLLPYQMLLVPLTGAWLERSTMEGPAQAVALAKLEQYFWASAFTSNFDQGGASQAEKDYRDLVAWLHSETQPETGKLIQPEAIGDLEITAQGLLTATVRKKALFRAVMAVTIRAGARDFHHGQPLVPKTYVERKYDSHHVFPKKRLADSNNTTRIDPSGHSPELILNRALIAAATNRRIGAKAPSTYLGDIQEEGVDLDVVLGSHLISVEDLKHDNYGEFILHRLDQLMDQIQKLTGKKVVPLPQDAVPSGEDADADESGDEDLL